MLKFIKTQKINYWRKDDKKKNASRLNKTQKLYHIFSTSVEHKQNNWAGDGKHVEKYLV
jgi:hypothetical protein